MSKHLSKYQIQMANRDIRKNSGFLAVKQMQVKTALRFHLMPMKMAYIQKSATVTANEDMGKA